MMTNKSNNGFDSFEMNWQFFDETGETEISMLINGENILEFNNDGMRLTTRWDLEDLAFWLRDFIDDMKNDPYPVNVRGKFASIKDINAREFDTDDCEEFDAYYDALDAWNLNHRWHTASNGAILADVYFQQVGDVVEISWNNTDCEGDVVFKFDLGGACVEKGDFCNKVNLFLSAYAEKWFDPLK